MTDTEQPIVVGDAPPPPLAAVEAPEGADKAAPEGRTWIVLEENTDTPPTGQPLSVNGDVCMVLPGEPVHLANRYIAVLDNAIVSVPVMDSGQKVIAHRPRHRFPYRKVPAPVAA